MSILVLAEHDHRALKAATLHAITAATKLGGDVDVLVAGTDCAAAAQAAAAVAGVARAIHVDAPHLARPTAENLAAQVLALAGGYSHIVAAAPGFGKNVLPRVAARLDVAQVSGR